MIIKNFEQLAFTPERRQLLSIAEAGYESIKTNEAVSRQVSYDAHRDVLNIQGQKFELKPFKRVICIGVGKAAFEAVSAVEQMLDKRISCGFVIDLKEGQLSNIACRIGTHPLPTVVNVQATQEVVNMLSHCEETDLVICIISGGGSALLCYPHDLTCEQEGLAVSSLMRQGASIIEVNTLRKHISRVKGGNLAKIAFPATIINLLFSDVPTDDLSLIASGPTVPDKTTAHDAKEIVERYSLMETLRLESLKIYETPKESQYFERVTSFLLVSPRSALKGMREKAQELGLKVIVLPDPYTGEASKLGAKIARETQRGICMLGAGESTVKVRGKGLGGRNQEMALGALLSEEPGLTFGTFASDGYDNTDAAGAIIDEDVRIRAKNLSLEPAAYLRNNDAYHFFEQLDSLLFTGLTGANVSDWFISIKI